MSCPFPSFRSPAPIRDVSRRERLGCPFGHSKTIELSSLDSKVGGVGVCNRFPVGLPPPPYLRRPVETDGRVPSSPEAVEFPVGGYSYRTRPEIPSLCVFSPGTPPRGCRDDLIPVGGRIVCRSQVMYQDPVSDLLSTFTLSVFPILYLDVSVSYRYIPDLNHSGKSLSESRGLQYVSRNLKVRL